MTHTVTGSTGDARARLARWVTEALAPPPLAVVTLLLVAWHTSHTVGDTLKWAAVGSVLAALLPFLHLLRKVRRGTVTDRHVRVRAQRPAVIVAFALGATTALVALARLGAPSEMIAVLGAGVAGSAVALAITLVWQISIHVGVVAGIITVFVLLLGPVALALVPLVPLVGWARVELHAHTVAQVVGGALTGSVVSGLAFVSLMRLSV